VKVSRATGYLMRTARLVLAIVLILAAAGFGAFLAAGYGEDDRGRSWVRAHLEIVRSQLAGLKVHLRKYKQAHGRFPTNDEGLAALDNFDAVIEPRLPQFAGATQEYPQVYCRFFWPAVRRVAEMYHNEDPENRERLLQELPTVLSGYLLAEDADLRGVRPFPVRLAIGEGDNVYILSSAGVLSPWFIPYVYENRRGLDPARFRDSPAEEDGERRYSVAVDDGVYVYSVGAQEYAAKLDRLWWRDNWPRFAGVGLLLAAVVMLVVFLRRVRWGRKAALAVTVAAAGAGAFVGTAARVTCYIMAPLFYRRDPQMLARRRELLERYRRRGVIGQEAYEKALSAMELKLGEPPAKAPGPSASRPTTSGPSQDSPGREGR